MGKAMAVGGSDAAPRGLLKLYILRAVYELGADKAWRQQGKASKRFSGWRV